MNTQEFPNYEHHLEHEHNSRALFIKLGWLLIAGLCSIFISILWWVDEIPKAYASAKTGVGLWLVAALSVLLSTNSWLQEQNQVAHKRANVDILVAGVVVSWFLVMLISWMSIRDQPRFRVIIDALSWLIALGLAILSRPSISRKFPSKPSFFHIAQFGWVWAGISFVVASVIWFKAEEGEAGAYMAGLAAMTFLIFLVCLRLDLKIQKERKQATNFPEWEARRKMLRLVCVTLNLVAVVLSLFFVFSLLAAALVAERGANISVSTTVVSALLGLIASGVSSQVHFEPIFRDRLRVFSSKAGTQYIFPVELLLLDETVSTITKIGATSASSPTTKR